MFNMNLGGFSDCSQCSLETNDLGCDEASIKAESGPEHVNEETFFEDELLPPWLRILLAWSWTLADLMMS